MGSVTMRRGEVRESDASTWPAVLATHSPPRPALSGHALRSADSGSAESTARYGVQRSTKYRAMRSFGVGRARSICGIYAAWDSVSEMVIRDRVLGVLTMYRERVYIVHEAWTW